MLALQLETILFIEANVIVSTVKYYLIRVMSHGYIFEYLNDPQAQFLAPISLIYCHIFNVSTLSTKDVINSFSLTIPAFLTNFLSIIKEAEPTTLSNFLSTITTMK